jgi:hypothetical protein
MAEDNRSYEERQESIVDDLKSEIEEIRSRAEAEREAAKPDEGETEEEYRARLAAVPGIFGDTDTTAGAAASGTDVPSKDNELATQAVAEAEAAAEEGDEEAEGATVDEARRQVDVAAGTTESSEEVESGAVEEDGDGDESAEAGDDDQSLDASDDDR